MTSPDSDPPRPSGGAWAERWARVAARPAVAAWIAVIWLVPMLVLKLRLLDRFGLTSDIAYYANMLHNTGYDRGDGAFRFLYTTYDVLRFMSGTFLTEHFSPTFALLAPLQWLLPHPLLLTILQPVLIAVAGLGLFRLTTQVGQRFGAPPLAAVLPAVVLTTYLFNASNLTATADSIYGFHHDSLIPPLIIWGLRWALAGRWKLATTAFLLLLGVKENMPIVLGAFMAACLPFGWLLPRRRAALGLVLCILFFAGCLWFQFRNANRHVSIVYQFLDPEAIDGALQRLGRWDLVLHLWPAWLALPFALPAAAEFCLQLMGRTIPYDWHSYPLMVFMLLGTMFTGQWLLGRAVRWGRLAPAAGLALLGLLLLPPVFAGVRNYGYLWQVAGALPRLGEREDAKRLLALVPADAKLGVTSDLLVWAAERRHLLWPESVDFAEYILVNRRTAADHAASLQAFAASSRPGDPGSMHFRDDLGVVVAGFKFDTTLLEYLDHRVATGTAKLVESSGRMSLYRANPGAQLPVLP
jgi:hypothetical protein